MILLCELEKRIGHIREELFEALDQKDRLNPLLEEAFDDKQEAYFLKDDLSMEYDLVKAKSNFYYQQKAEAETKHNQQWEVISPQVELLKAEIENLKHDVEQYGESMSDCYEKSQQCYLSGDGEQAKILSEEGGRYKSDRDSCREAAKDKNEQIKAIKNDFALFRDDYVAKKRLYYASKNALGDLAISKEEAAQAFCSAKTHYDNLKLEYDGCKDLIYEKRDTLDALLAEYVDVPAEYLEKMKIQHEYNISLVHFYFGGTDGEYDGEGHGHYIINEETLEIVFKREPINNNQLLKLQ